MRWPARIGRWEIRGALGSGRTAEVLLGVDEAGEVAIKRPPAERVDDAVVIDLLLAEARLLAKITHPNVVRFIELVDGAPPSLVMERLRGRPLAELPLAADPALALRVGADIAAALEAVHASADAEGPLRAVHRDVSPDNLFLTDEGTKLLDFNVAFYRGREQAPAPGALQGRIAYMAPEQARSEPVDGSADVFALGVVMWERLAGARLMWRGNTLATLRAVIDEPIPRASERIEVPAALDGLVAEMLERDPRMRPTAADVVKRLRALEPA